MNYGYGSFYENQSRNLGPVRDKNKRPKRHIALLVTTKCLLVLAIFSCYEVLRELHFVQLLFFAKLCAAIIFTLVHKPVSHGKQLTIKEYKHIALYSLLTILLTYLWLEALVICGAVRTVLLWQHSDIAIISILNLFFYSESSLPTACIVFYFRSSSPVGFLQGRGTVFYVLGVSCLLFFDRDHHKHIDTTGDHTVDLSSHVPHHVYHHFINVFDWLGLPDHKGGILLLILLSFLQVFVNNYGKSIALQIDGHKRLKSLSTCFEVVFIAPLWFLFWLTSNEESASTWSYLPQLIFITLIIFIGDFYVEGVSTLHLHKYLTHRLGTIVAFCAVIPIGIFWDLQNDLNLKHKISVGVIFASLFFITATRLLVQPPPVKPRGNLIGYTTSGEPLYSIATIDGYVPKSLFIKLRQYIRIVLESPDSRNIFLYLCLNLVFTGVELLYGVWTNSLGLISDGFHMLFDCSALVLGLWASIASKWGANKTFSFGYARLEVLSGFVNGLFLVVIGFAVFMTAIQRVFDPPTVKTEKLLVVSVLGLLVNLVGITAFSHAHSHGGKKCEGHGHSHAAEKSHGHSHSHSHSHGGHGHSHGENKHGHSHGKHEHGSKEKSSANMQGVYLHVLADTMGSVGVIFSSLLIEYYELYIADPVCSLFISVLILLSVLPLLKDSALVLIQRVSKDIEESVTDALQKICDIDGVLSYRNVHFWQHTPEVDAGTVIVQINNTANEHKIRQQVISLLKASGVGLITVQVEKEAFHEHMLKLTTGYYSTVSFPEPKQYISNYNEMTVRVRDI